MSKAIKTSLIFLGLFFCPLSLSEPGNLISNYQELDPGYYLFHFVPAEKELSDIYKVMSVSQMKDYLVFNIEKLNSDNFKYYNRLGNHECFLKKIVPRSELERITKHSKIIFSIKDIEKYNLREPGEPGIPLPAPLPYVEKPGEPGIPLPAPLPYVEKPGEPGIPLPAPLPYVEKPGEPGIPLPAPLPYYINTDNDQLVVSYKSKDTVLDLNTAQWENNFAQILEEYFHRLEKTCDE